MEESLRPSWDSFSWSFDAGQPNITRIQELIGHNKVCITFGHRTWCSDCAVVCLSADRWVCAHLCDLVCARVCVCKLLKRYKCLNLGSILTTCNCRTWEMTAEEALFVTSHSCGWIGEAHDSLYLWLMLRLTSKLYRRWSLKSWFAYVPQVLFKKELSVQFKGPVCQI